MMQQRTTSPTTTVPQALQSPRAKLVYLYLSTHEGATITELQDALGMQKLSLYSILRTLTDGDFVSGERERYEVVR